MHCSLYGGVAHIADLLSLQLPRDYSTRAASFFPHFSFHSQLHTLRKLPWPPSTLGIVKWARLVMFRYPTRHEVVIKSSLATNLSRRQALFVQGNYCSSVFWWSARHAFLPKKIEKNRKKSSTYHGTKSCVLYVMCAWYFDRVPRIWKTKGAGNKPLNQSVPLTHPFFESSPKKIVTTYAPYFIYIYTYNTQHTQHTQHNTPQHHTDIYNT